MATYEIVTDAAREFDNDYNYATVLDSWHQTASNEDVADELVLVTEVEERETSAYEAALNADSAVIVWSRTE
jgi:hypothetical protein